MVSIELRLRPDEVARVMKAIEAAAESEPPIDGGSRWRRPRYAGTRSRARRWT